MNQLPLFPDNWQAQVRLFLGPFEREQRGEVAIYALETVEEQRQEEGDFTAHYRLGTASLWALGTQPLSDCEESAGFVWAAKSDFEQPLHFWAGATLAWNASWNAAAIDYSWPQQSTPVTEPNPIFSYWPPLWGAQPAVAHEKRVRGWHLSNDWDTKNQLWETENSYFFQGWLTTA